MALLDVNALVALAWNQHIRHHVVRAWLAERKDELFATCPITESGFVRISSNPLLLAQPISVAAARGALAGLRSTPRHRFLRDDVSAADADFPSIVGHRQVTDAHLITLARRSGQKLVTFDRGAKALGGDDVILLSVLS